MDSVIPIGSAPAKGCVMATLAIPKDAICVVAPPPETISQRNVEAVTGVPSKAYLAAIRGHGFPLRVTRLGKLRIVNRAAFVAWLEGGAFGAAAAKSDGEDEDEGGREEGAGGAERVLHAVGYRATPPLRRPRQRR